MGTTVTQAIATDQEPGPGEGGQDMMKNTMVLIFMSVCLLLLSPGLSQAIEVHNFDCKNCHKTGVSFTDLGNGTTNICLQCHKDPAATMPMLDGDTPAPTGLFAPTDASNALDSYPNGLTPPATAGAQSSHMWAAKDFKPAAGAQAPTDYRFFGRYGISNGKITCQRCHDPHSRDATNTKILRMWPEGREAMCIECHAPWNLDNTDHGLLTHPMVADYAAVQTANPDKYNTPAQVAAAIGEIQLVDGAVSCSSCHGVHFADSHSATTDGPGQALSEGDGKLLRADGPTRADTSGLCQACHTYQAHGSAVETVGCMVCHSGHSYNGGSPNYYVLRSTAETTTYGIINGLAFTDLPAALGGGSTTTALWGGSVGSDNGYCERCHGELTSMAGSSRSHIEGENCKDCHNHNGAGMSYSFEANCTDCHGWPPAAASAGGPNGYAFVASPARDYATSGVYKDETNTPHLSHAGPASGYQLACGVCHDADDFGATHNQGSYQDVLMAGNSHDPLATGGGVLTPSYNTTGAGTCSNVYCHSNGGRRNASGTKALSDFTTVNVAWGGQKGSITGCADCHGNDWATMNGVNSPVHEKHLAKGYGCNVCHVDTATGATALAGGARGGAHVNGAVDVSFDNGYNLGGAALGAGSYGNTNGTCSVYCHSDGQGTNATPDWDDAASGACGTCHAATPSSGSHSAHLAAAGANIGCATCHGANAATAGHSGHVDGAKTVVAGICDSCHAVDAQDGSSTPTWGNAASAVCDSCHAGSAATSYTDAGSTVRSAPAKSAFFSAGHGKTTATGGSTPPNTGCTGCHDTAYDAAHMGAGSSDRLKVVNGQTYSTASPNAFCSACHDGGSADEIAHFATGGSSADGTKCNLCHDPHGVAGYDAMIMSTVGGQSVAAFADKTVRGNYANGSFDGICQVCHENGEVSRFNRATYDAGHGNGQVCTDCHNHTASTAFDPSCYNCHGGGSTGSVSQMKNFWPDSSSANTANDAGEHQVHMLKIAQRFNAGWTTVDALLNGATKTEQRQMCEYCHAAVENDFDHMSASSAEVFNTTVGGSSVRFAKRIWDGSDDVDAADTAGSCSAVDCHNGKTTAAAYKWYAGGSSACAMCHVDNLPATGSHSAHMSTVFSVYYATGQIGCPDCHSNTTATSWSGNSAPTGNHMDGTFDLAGSRGLSYTGTYLGYQNAGNVKGSCGTNSCHNDGKNGSPASAYTWDTTSLSSCTSCHTNSAEGHLPHFMSGGTIVSASFFGFNCDKCHTHGGSNADHFNGTVSLKAAMNYSGGVTVGDGIFNGTCTTTTCHQNGAGVAVETPAWNRTPVSGDECSLCHSNLPVSGSHGDHVRTAASAYTTVAANSSTATDYDFNCANCHDNSLANHIDGSKTLVSQGWTGTKCSASYCHSNGKYGGVTYADSPNWNGGTFAGDKCAGCHLNTPDTNAHHEHEVGFHFDAVYSGVADFLPVTDADPVPAGLTYGDKDEIRGHGGRLADGITSTSTIITCNVCHNATVTVWYNDKNTTCAACHNGSDAALQGDAAISDKSVHVNGQREVRFFNQKVRSKAQLRDIVPDIPGANSNWTEIPELRQSWVRINGYKADDGSSYDESPDTLLNTGIFDNGSGANGGTAANPTCLVSCHLINQTISDGNLDKEPVGWADGGRMCIDCHTRLPK